MNESRYMLYGAHLASSFPFTFNLLPPEEPRGEVDLSFSVLPVNPEYTPEGVRAPVENYEGGRVELFLSETCETLYITGVCGFEMRGNEITAHPLLPDIEYLIEIFFVGNVMSFWLERQGILMLHASAVKAGDGCVAFIADSGTGKTTLATACVAGGYPLVTDDILALSVGPDGVTAFPGFPQMKLFSHQLKILGGNPDNYGKIHPGFEKLKIPVGSISLAGQRGLKVPQHSEQLGSFYSHNLPLTAIYFLSRNGSDQPSVTPVGAAEGVMSLVRHAFAAELLDAVDRGQKRLGMIGAVAAQVPVQILNIPEGYERLPDVIAFLNAAPGRSQVVR